MSDLIEDEGELVASGATVALLNASEIDQQIATAHKYPRSIARFRKSVQEMVTLSDAIAGECIYSLVRGNKTISGPSARFAEVVASAWGNVRAGARVVSDQGDFITAQGVFHDLERNVAITYEVQRRITGSDGRRYNTDMIGVTGNAASSIALRNAILKGVPKAFWSEMYEGAKQMARGNVETLPNKREAVLKDLLGYGVKPEHVYAKLRIQGMADIGLDHLLTLRGLVTAIKDGDTTPEQAFAPEEGAPPVVGTVKRKSEHRPDDGTNREPQPGSPGYNDGTAREGESSNPKANPTTGEIDKPAAAGTASAAAKWVRKQFDKLGLDADGQAAMLARLGIDNLDNMTAEQYDAVRAEILANG